MAGRCQTDGSPASCASDAARSRRTSAASRCSSHTRSSSRMNCAIAVVTCPPPSGARVAPAAGDLSVCRRLFLARALSLAPQQGLAAVHGRGAPGDELAGPGDRFLSALVDAFRGHPRAPHQLVDPGLPLVGGVLPLVGPVLPLVGGVLPLVGQVLPPVSQVLPPVGQVVSPV